MCLMTEKQTPYTEDDPQQENKSTVTDNILLSDTSGYTDQEHDTVDLQLKWKLTQNIKPRVFEKVCYQAFEKDGFGKLVKL